MTTTNSSTAMLEMHGNVALLTLNRPETLNAFNRTLVSDLHARLREVFRSDGARALVLTGAGKGFCSGADLTSRATDINPKDPGEMMRELYTPAFALLREMKVPTIAAVNGACAGAGVSLALSCDFVLAAESAFFLQAFVNIGLVPDMGSSWLLPHRIGDARARALMMLGERLPAAKAEEWGLIYKCLPAEQLLDEALRLATKLAAGPTTTYGWIRDLGRLAWQNDLAAQIDAERHLQARALQTEDHRNAVQSFKDKVPPHFSGK